MENVKISRGGVTKKLLPSDVTAFEHWDLGITCKNCGSYLEYGSYNPTRYCE